MARIVVAMSGGVDSSVAAMLLKEQGHEIIGISMRLYDAAEGDNDRYDSCCSLEDFADARRVCDKLGVPFYIMDYEDEFRRRVIEPFVEEYKAGRTPNPCALCNQWLKFDHLVAHGDALEADFVATGHYVRRTERNGEVELRCGVDEGKDQSYFLFGLTRSQLHRALFPLGDLTKAEVREIARRGGLRTAEKKESQEICFVPKGDYAAFVESVAGPLPEGDIVDTAGQVLGDHGGIHRYTVGQRRGLGLSASEPLYVRSIEPASNRVVVGRRHELAAVGLEASRVNWLTDPEPREILVKIRYRHRGIRGTVYPQEQGRAKVVFDEAAEAVSPGQAAVFYDGDRVLGGGWIERPIWGEE